MLLKEVLVEGFRNFKECKVAFNQKTLIIGPNDIGKSNLIYAMRLLLDKSFSENDLEPDESDFYAHENTAQIKITLFFSGATEDCIRSKFKENIGSNGDLVIRYVGLRSGATSQKRYEIYAGPSLDNLKEFESRFYLRALNLSYINSNRDLLAFIKREKRNLLQQAKDQRTAAQILADDVALKSVESSLTSVSTSVSKLTYIESATIGLNKELGSLSVSNSNLSVFFDSGASDPAAFVDNLQLASKYKDKRLSPRWAVRSWPVSSISSSRRDPKMTLSIIYDGTISSGIRRW
jgi:putative ATP-dependent endonuclease of OLD family